MGEGPRRPRNDLNVGTASQAVLAETKRLAAGCKATFHQSVILITRVSEPFCWR